MRAGLAVRDPRYLIVARSGSPRPELGECERPLPRNSGKSTAATRCACPDECGSPAWSQECVGFGAPLAQCSAHVRPGRPDRCWNASHDRRRRSNPCRAGSQRPRRPPAGGDRGCQGPPCGLSRGGRRDGRPGGPARATDEELGIIKTDDTVGKIAADASQQIGSTLSRVMSRFGRGGKK